MTDAAMIRPQGISWVEAPESFAMPTGTVTAFGLDDAKVSAKRYSFHAAMKARSPVVTSAGHISGMKMRVMMTQDGRLAADPAIGGGSANIKAIEMLQSAIAALKQCQPYKMLPVDRYGEWRVLDLEFTPKDFSG